MSQLILTSAQMFGRAAARSVATGVARGAAAAIANYAYQGLENLILGPVQRSREGPRIDQFRLQSSTPGTGIPILFGRARIAGQIIWASNFLETTETETTSRGGKGGGRRVETRTTSYVYSISLAIGLCEGEISRIGRVWADGREISLRDYEHRLYRGTPDQLPDPLIEAVEGVSPAFRNLAYIVLEDLPLAEFGNRVPQFNFEIFRQPPANNNVPRFVDQIEAVALIPGSGENVYDVKPVSRLLGEGESVAENAHSPLEETDFLASINHLQASLPKCKSISLIVSWFANDLRAGHCLLKPGVEEQNKQTLPTDWYAGGVNRATAHLVSTANGAPAFGGTPSDQSVVAAIKNLHDRGMAVTFYPFLLMDIAPDNQLPSPALYGGGIGQPAYPWRGRIVAEADVQANIDHFMGTAQASDFTVNGDQVQYVGPAEWGLRRMILHYAHLCKAAGGVERFLLGSELVGLSCSRIGGTYPFVNGLKDLASEVRAILGSAVQLSYAADWSEYFGHHPQDGSNDIYFHLDELWADSNIDFIGIDNYLPLADWREGDDHLDASKASSIYDLSYLQSNIAGGEYYDFYYASAADRQAQIRTPISDTAYGEDWLFRPKDIQNWWRTPHHNRPGGVRQAQATPYVPESKPIVFTELGCAAMHFAANQPNKFRDAKSSEDGLPYFSNGNRDDAMQRAFLQAHLTWWADGQNNPISALYNGPMVDITQTALYAWDARPFPDFPFRSEIWHDAANWDYGHWLNGRTDLVNFEDLVRSFQAIEDSALFFALPPSLLSGFVIDRPMALRDGLAPLLDYFSLLVVENGDGVSFRKCDHGVVTTLTLADMVATEGEPYICTLPEARELPDLFTLSFLDAGASYEQTVAEYHDPLVKGRGLVHMNLPLMLEHGEAQAKAQQFFHEIRARATSISFSLPPERLDLEPGDLITIEGFPVPTIFCISEISVDDVLTLRAQKRAELTDLPAPISTRSLPPPPPVWPQPVFGIIDAPVLDLSGLTMTPSLLAYAYSGPWPGSLFVYDQGANGGWRGEIGRPSLIGRLSADLPPGVTARWQYGQTILCQLQGGTLASMDALSVLDGDHLVFIDHGGGQWELVQFQQAIEGADGIWSLSNLLRGQGGTEALAAQTIAAGARLVFYNKNLLPLALETFQLGADYRYGAGPANLSPNDPTFQTVDFSANKIGLRPLAPVHLRIASEAAGLNLSWIRRSRIGGDEWGVAEIPLAEEEERYRLRFSVNGATVFEAESSRMAYLWSQQDQQSALAGQTSGLPVHLSIAQFSQSFGYGEALEAIISFVP